MEIKEIAERFAEYVFETFESWAEDKRPKRYSKDLSCIIADWCGEWCKNRGYQLTDNEIKVVEDAAEKQLNEYWLDEVE